MMGSSNLALFSLQQTGPKAGTPGVAEPQGAPGAAPAGQQPQGSPIMMFLPFLIMIPFFFLMSRRQKKEAEARQNLKKGQTVLTQSGLIGELVEMDERIAKVKIAPGTTVRVLVSSLGPLDAPAATKDEGKDKDIKEAKATAGGDKK